MNIVPSLGITTFHENNDDVNNDNIDKTITTFEGYPRIAAIKKWIKKSNNSFISQNVSTDRVASIIKNLNTTKASKSNSIPTKVIKGFVAFFAEFLSKKVNSCLKTRSFSETWSMLTLFSFTRKMIYRIRELWTSKSFIQYFKSIWKMQCKNNLAIYYQNFRLHFS